MNMRKRLLKTFASLLLFLCIPALILPACSSSHADSKTRAILTMPIWLPYLGLVVAKEAIEDVADDNRKAAAERRVAAQKMRLEKKQHKAWLALAKEFCPAGHSDFCYELFFPSKSFDMNAFVAALDGMEELSGDPRMYSMLGLFALNAGPRDPYGIARLRALGMRPTVSGSKHELLIRAAFLRRALGSLWIQRRIQRSLQLEHDLGTGIEFDNTPQRRAELNKKRLREVRRRLVWPDREIQQMADRLLELDQAIIAARPNQNLDPYDELVLGLDTELRAWFGPENEFRHWAGQAQSHF
jgi:hypothetical protein